MWEVGPYGQKLLAKEEKREKSSRNTARVGKRQQRTVSSQLASNNLYSILHPEKLKNKLNCHSNIERAKDVQYTLQPLKEVQIKVGLEKLKSHEGIVVKALLDSGVIGLFMDTKFAKKKEFKLEKLKNLLLVRNVDRIANIREAITYQIKCNMFFKEDVERVQMDVCNLGKTKVILDMPWLVAHNLEIDWEKGKVKMTWCLPICRKRKQEMQEKRQVRKTVEEKTVEELVPRRFQKWKKVFGKEESERIPTQKPWDHAIELKEGFVPRKGKVYLLLREEREKVQAFIEDQLQKEYIQLSKSLQTLPVYFVAKKNRKRRMVQDYYYINQWTVKNRYPLLLITDILDKVEKKKVFIKLDLKWGYNNVRIKEGNEWKTTFIIHIRVYEPTVMYFGLTNSSAIFQTIMNDLF